MATDGIVPTWSIALLYTLNVHHLYVAKCIRLWSFRIGVYLLDNVDPSRIYPAQPFLGRSCQNKLMRSNNFEVNVPVTMCIEVEALAKNYYGCEPILKFSLHGQQA